MRRCRVCTMPSHRTRCAQRGAACEAASVASSQVALAALRPRFATAAVASCQRFAFVVAATRQV